MLDGNLEEKRRQSDTALSQEKFKLRNKQSWMLKCREGSRIVLEHIHGDRVYVSDNP